MQANFSSKPGELALVLRRVDGKGLSSFVDVGGGEARDGDVIEILDGKQNNWLFAREGRNGYAAAFDDQ